MDTVSSVDLNWVMLILKLDLVQGKGVCVHGKRGKRKDWRVRGSKRL